MKRFYITLQIFFIFFNLIAEEGNLLNITSSGESGMDYAMVDPDMYSPLMIAIMEDNNELFNELVLEKTELDKLSSYGDNALMVACEYGKLEMAEILIKAGLDINHKNNDGITSLLVALFYNQSHNL